MQLLAMSLLSAYSRQDVGSVQRPLLVSHLSVQHFLFLTVSLQLSEVLYSVNLGSPGTNVPTNLLCVLLSVLRVDIIPVLLRFCFSLNLQAQD